ncbi:hypothetical protein GCM10018785_37920 [Streptomyces longispororuber]|uniref:Uncharacterized protein n=1 Tax=Streptomyces longispororuber TaxID=68230 RepID=A0A918ZQW5_9ACTN|nr:hypothetical protein GCM10018785_37920 [Streptomyces longispororuber]
MGTGAAADAEGSGPGATGWAAEYEKAKHVSTFGAVAQEVWAYMCGLDARPSHSARPQREVVLFRGLTWAKSTITHTCRIIPGRRNSFMCRG